MNYEKSWFGEYSYLLSHSKESTYIVYTEMLLTKFKWCIGYSYTHFLAGRSAHFNSQLPAYDPNHVDKIKQHWIDTEW